MAKDNTLYQLKTSPQNSEQYLSDYQNANDSLTATVA